MSDEKPCRILVVDSYKDAADSLKTLISMWNYEVEATYSSDEAIEVAKKFDPDVVLLEVVLPITSGYKLGKILQKKYPKIKIVALTGLGTPAHVALSQEKGFRYHLVKPVAPERLAQIIKDDLCKKDCDCEKCKAAA